MSNTGSSTIKTHTFEHINDVPLKIKAFYVENEQGQVQLITKTETCSLERLQLFIERGNTAHIELAAERVATAKKWQYFDAYHAYLAQVAQVKAFNADIPIIGKDDNGGAIYAQPKDIPTEPEAIPDITGANILAPFYVRYLNNNGTIKWQR